MAKVTAPLLSFAASGKIADTLVAFSWKGVNVMRQYVIPTNPKSAGQVTQRTLFTAMVSAWRNYFTDTEMRTGWNKTALLAKKAMSGFNAAMASMIKVCSPDADASYGQSYVEAAGETVVITLVNCDDGAQADEAGDYSLWAGSLPDALLFVEDVALVGGDFVSTVSLGTAADVVYFKLVKGGYDRTGICKATLIA